ncbi:MAG: redox-sensing transcriptional repressor Rex [Clostridia bacterium]|nr:redox-sensing transcriptional repressor Rex [Clostridia bacterium]
MNPKKNKVSMSVIRRLPRYYRFLSELERKGVLRISSRELSDLMGLTASQIRQDLNCFGGFGQQGFGYMVPVLKSEIGSILGLDKRYKTILLGAGNLGRAVAAHIAFENQGFSLVGIFDRDPALFGRTFRGVPVRPEIELEDFCRSEQPDVAILCVPMESAEELSERLIALGIRNFWNFSHYDFSVAHPEVVIENVHMNDSLMTLCYRIQHNDGEE